MQTKEVTKMLGVNRERIKYFKKQNVFMPENTVVDSKSAEYTEGDVTALRKLVILTKSGLTCGDIKRIQNGEWTLQEAIVERRKIIEDEMRRMRGSLSLTEEMVKIGVQFDSMPIEYLWNEIQQKEHEGEAFMDFEDMYGYRPVPLMRSGDCPHCNAVQEIDLVDYLWDETLNESHRENDMGPDIVYSFDTEDCIGCDKCGKAFQVRGWIREYPVGAYDSEHIDILKVEGCHEEN